MNKDASGISATDPAAPAAVSTAPATTPAERFDEMDEPGKVSDVIDIVEHFETDDELAAFAVDRLNSSIAATASADLAGSLDAMLEQRSYEHRLQAYVATSILTSRALMRSAAAHERLAAVGERNERRLLETRVVDEESRKLHLENLRLQNRAFTGEIERISAIADYALAFARDVNAGRLEGSTDPASNLAEFSRCLLAMAGGNANAPAVG